MRKQAKAIRRARYGKGLLVVFRRENGRLDVYGFSSPACAMAFAAKVGNRLTVIL